MKRKITFTALFASLCLLSLSSMGWEAAAGNQPETTMQSDPDTFNIEGEIVVVDREATYRKNPNISSIKLISRSYGDSIVLRWAGEDYPTQQVLYDVGVNIYRIDHTEGMTIDTLAERFRPWTQAQFEAFYPKSDSVAYMAIGLMYSDNWLRPDQTKSAPGTMGSILDIVEDQKSHLAFSVLVSEWRKDVADHMAMRWVDRNVVKDHEYEYFVLPSERDESGHITIASANTRLTNTPYVKPKYDIAMGDSVVGPYKVRLWWEDKGISSYEIDRRRVGESQWKRVNSLPYINMTTDTERDANFDVAYGDVVDEVGEYEYRIFGHDAFGELTEPSPIHRVYMPDLVGPRAPELTLVEIDRQDPTDLSKKVMATFHFSKDTMEQDFIGFMPMYYSSMMDKDNYTGRKEWKKLSDKLLSPTDTTFTCDMTGFSTGLCIVAAYDTAQNVSYSMPRMVQIKDVKAPSMMRNFKAETSIEDGTITLTWEPDSVDDDIEYYELTYANDTTHTFILRSEGKLKETRFVDTVAMDVNQKYIYYKVRAIDYSTNQGVETPALQVIRPTRLKPSVAHLVNSIVDSAGIHMDWACSNEQIMDHHVLLRRLDGVEKWDTIGVFNADTVNANGHLVKFVDNPKRVRGKEYQYCMESFSCNGVSSGHSLVFYTRYEPSRYVNMPLTLKGRYDKEAKKSVLEWEVNHGKPLEGDWWVCIYRKGPEDRGFNFHISVAPTDTERRSARLAAGQTEQYYIKVRFRDGRESRMSDIVTITAPEAPVE